MYNTQKYFFVNDGYDASGLLKNYYIYQDSSRTSDTTQITHLQNEFNYSFYLRGKKLSFLRNELKVNVGLQHDYYKYQQYANGEGDNKLLAWINTAISIPNNLIMSWISCQV